MAAVHTIPSECPSTIVLAFYIESPLFSKRTLLPLVPIRSCFLLPWERATTMFEGLFVLGKERVFYLVKVSDQKIILPVLSPEIKELVSVRLHNADTEPVCPTIAFMHFPLSQK